jgi:hypothetical protein
VKFSKRFAPPLFRSAGRVAMHIAYPKLSTSGSIKGPDGPLPGVLAR